MAATVIFPLEVWTSQITQASIPANNNSLRVQILEQAAVAQVSSPPATPNENDIYVLGAVVSGGFSTFQPNNVVIYKGGTWLEFEKFKGWMKTIGNDVYMYNGTEWVAFAVGPSAEAWKYSYLTTDLTNNTVNYIDIPNTSFNFDANSRYVVECMGSYQTAASTTGLGIKLFTTDANSSLIGKLEVFTANNTSSGLFQATTSTTLTTTGVPAANADTVLEGKWVLATGETTGSAILQLKSEVANSLVTISANRWYVRWRKLP